MEEDAAEKIRQDKLEKFQSNPAPSSRSECIYGKIEKLASNLSGAVVTIPSTKNFRLWGFRVTGQGNATIALLVDNKPLIPGKVLSESPVDECMLPDAHPIPDGCKVELMVTNKGIDELEFEGMVYGHVS